METAPNNTTKVKQELFCSFDGCDKVFFKASKLSRHELTHTGERPFACTHEGCDKKFTRDCHLKRHLQTVHSTEKERNFQCTKEGCDAAFFSKQHLNRHEKLHEKAKPFECEFPNCSQSFGKHNQLLIHICKEHTHQQPYKCNQLINGEECDKRFQYPSELKKHIKSAHNNSKYLCGYENCGESFTHSKDLQQHIHQKHENERKIICNICFKLYKTNRSLSQHQLNVHTDKFVEFTCDRGDPPCGKSFKYEKNLQAHIRTAHDKLKPFSCDICDRKFDYNYLLTRHRIKNHADNNNNNNININNNLDNEKFDNIITNNNEINNEIIINIQNSSADSASDCETTSMTITPTSQLINVSSATPILPMLPVITGVKRLLDRPLLKSKRHKKFPLATFVGLPKESDEKNE